MTMTEMMMDGIRRTWYFRVRILIRRPTPSGKSLRTVADYCVRIKRVGDTPDHYATVRRAGNITVVHTTMIYGSMMAARTAAVQWCERDGRS